MALTPEAVVRTWFEELWNKGDEGTIDRFLHAECVVHGLPMPDGGPMCGPTGFRPFYQRFRAAFPNVHVELLHVIPSGELVVAHCRVAATHAGDALGVPATNCDVTFEGFVLVCVRDGRIVEAWNTFDFMGMYQQLGMQFDLP
jgi:predicted ester cyclase